MTAKKVALVDIAKALKMSPKVARRKMRNNWPRRPKKWEFNASQRKAVVAALKN